MIIRSYNKKSAVRKPRVNNQIQASEVRVIGTDGENKGILPISEAIELAKSQGLVLIEVAAKTNPPVARIMDLGKYQYQKEKEARAARKKVKEIGVHGIRARLTISPHDLELKLKKVEEFLARGDHIRFELILRGREKGLRKEFIRERLDKMLDMIISPYAVVDGPKRGPRGLIVTIASQHHAKNKQGGTKTHQSDQNGENPTPSPAAKPL